MNEQKKLYPERDPTDFVDYYMRHVEAMTSEELFGKGDIAVQLAWRDREIDQLRQRLAELELLNRQLRQDFDNAAWEAEAKLALAEQGVAALRGFAQAVMECWPEGDVDGGYLQDMAEKHGLLKPEERTIPCGENCGCAEFYMSGEVATCYRGTPLLRGAAIARQGDEHV